MKKKNQFKKMAQASPYLGMPQLSSPYSHYTMSASPMLQVVSPAEAAVNSQLGVVAAAQAGGAGGYHGAPASKLQRSDRIEVREKNIFILKKQKKTKKKQQKFD